MSDPPIDPASPVELRRRPIRARDTRWAHALARAVGRMGIRPNQISILSIAWAALGAAALVGAGETAAAGWKVALLIGAGFCVQMRLLCNLLDGLVAVEGGLRTKSGEIYNELPDRISDLLLLAAAGYATLWTGWEGALGWAAAALAIMVAYVRALGGQVGATQQFCGPMAKQQRMFVLTTACASTALEYGLGWIPRTMACFLAVIFLGSIWTVARRVARIVGELETR